MSLAANTAKQSYGNVRDAEEQRTVRALAAD